MSHFDRLPEFEKELMRLAGKYRSLRDDLLRLEKIISLHPTGVGTNFTIIHRQESVAIVKARLACRALKGRSIRLIYAYHAHTTTFMYIELYFKGDKENEDRERIKEYLRNHQ